MLSKSSKHSKSIREIEDQFKELSKYSKSPPEETIAERAKLIHQKRKRQKTGTRKNFLTPSKLLTRIPILLAQIKAGNNSNKLENETRQILYLLYQHNKITKKLYRN